MGETRKVSIVSIWLGVDWHSLHCKVNNTLAKGNQLCQKLYRGAACFHRLTVNKRLEQEAFSVRRSIQKRFVITPVHSCVRYQLECCTMLLLNEVEHSAIFAGNYVTCRASMLVVNHLTPGRFNFSECAKQNIFLKWRGRGVVRIVWL